MLMYDEQHLQARLVRRLTADRSVKVRVHVDRGAFLKRTCHQQASRLKTLFDLGAKVFLCRGVKVDGVFHHKLVVTNKRYAWSGGGNLTKASRHKNRELLLKLVGPGVQKMLASVSEARLTAEDWTIHFEKKFPTSIL